MPARPASGAAGPEVIVDGMQRFAPNTSFQHCYDRPPREYFDAHGCVTYRIDNWSYRADFTIEKPSDTYRVVEQPMVGGSGFVVNALASSVAELYTQRNQRFRQAQSERNAAIGSTFKARRTGTMHASRQTPSMTSA